MAILRSTDWKKLIQLCKTEIQNTKGDRGDTRAARGLLYRLTFYISENRLVKPQRRMKQESPIQKGIFGKFDRGVIEEEGTPLSPKEVKNADDNIRLQGSSELSAKKENSERPQGDGQDHADATEPSERPQISRREEAGEVSQHPDPGGRNQI